MEKSGCNQDRAAYLKSLEAEVSNLEREAIHLQKKSESEDDSQGTMNGNEIAESDENYADETNSEDESEDEVQTKKKRRIDDSDRVSQLTNENHQLKMELEECKKNLDVANKVVFRCKMNLCNTKFSVVKNAMEISASIDILSRRCTVYIRGQYDIQRLSGQFKFGTVLVAAKHVEVLTKLTDEAPTTMLPRFCELAKGRKYCLANVLKGNSKKRNFFDVQCKQDIFDYCKEFCKELCTEAIFVKAYGTWRSQHWPAKGAKPQENVMILINREIERENEELEAGTQHSKSESDSDGDKDDAPA